MPPLPAQEAVPSLRKLRLTRFAEKEPPKATVAPAAMNVEPGPLITPAFQEKDAVTVISSLPAIVPNVVRLSVATVIGMPPLKLTNPSTRRTSPTLATGLVKFTMTKVLG